MYESDDDLRELQQLLDDSHAAGGSHLRDVHEPRWRMDAEEVVSRMLGMRLLALATSTSDGRPIVSPVDGFFVGGRFWFGSSPTSLRAAHLAARPAVSCTHTPVEEICVTVHGEAVRVDGDDPRWPDLSRACTQLYGEGWDEWAGEHAYWRIEPRRMFTFRLDRSLL